MTLLRCRLCSFDALIEQRDDSTETSNAWLDAGRGLCQTLMGWISFHAFCNHVPSASGLLRRSRLRIQSLEASSWSLAHSDAEQQQWWRERVLSAQSAVRAQLAEVFGEITTQPAASQTSLFGELAVQLKLMQHEHGDPGGWGWRGKGKAGLKLGSRGMASEELERLWALGEEGIREHVATVMRQVAQEWQVPEGVALCHTAIEAVVEAEREDIARSIGSDHATTLFGALFGMAAPRGLLHRDRLALETVISAVVRKNNLDGICLEGFAWPPPMSCISRTCLIDTTAVHKELQTTAFAAIEGSIEEAIEALEAATVRECCIWQATAQAALREAQDATAAVSGLYSSSFTPRNLEEVGWRPGEEGHFDGSGGELIQSDPLLAKLQKQVTKQLKWFASWQTPDTLTIAADGKMEADGMQIVVLNPEFCLAGREDESSNGMGAMVPLAGLAALGVLERGAAASLSQGKMLELRMDGGSMAPWLAPGTYSPDTQQITALHGQRQSVVMAGRAVRKTFNFAGKALAAATAPTALLFEVISIATAQYYMHEINAKLEKIEKTLSRQELRQACTAMGTLQACAVLANELKQEFTVLSELPVDWRVRCNQVLRDVTHGLCIAETSVASFLARVEEFVQTEQPKARAKLLKNMNGEMAGAQQDFTCLLGYSKVLVQLRELQALADLRSGSERTALSAMRVDDALLGLSERLALFGRLEELVSSTEGGMAELSWLQKNIMNRSAGLYARQVASSINGLHRSIASSSGTSESSEWSQLRYLLTLSAKGDAVHVRAMPDEENAPMSLGW